MLKRSISHRPAARLGTAILGIAVLLAGTTLPVLGAEPTLPGTPVETQAADPMLTGPDPISDPSAVPSEPAVEESGPTPTPTTDQAPTATAEPNGEPTSEPIGVPSPTTTTEIVTTSPAAPSTVVEPATSADQPTYVVTAKGDTAVGCYGSRAALDISVAPTPQGGSVSVYHDGSFLWTVDLDASGSAQVSTDELVYGTNSFGVDFIPAGATDVASTTTATIEGRYYCVELALSADRDSAVSGETLVGLTANVSGDWGDGASVTFSDEFNGGKTLGTATVADVNGARTATLRVRLTGVGTHVVRAAYNGDDSFAATASPTVKIDVRGDTSVAASGVGVSYTAFYPYKDGYRDTVAVRGTLLERASVSVGIYASTGRKVRSFSVANREGGYSVAWNGRYASGSRVAAGRYRVVQTVRDLAGNTRAYTSYTAVSNKRLYWSTGTLTKYGNQYSGYDYSSFGWVLPSYKYSRGVNLYGNIYDNWAFAGYSFTLPAATSYGTLTFKVLGSPQPGYGASYLSFWNYANQSEDAARWVGRSYAWYSTSVAGASHVSSRHVSAYVTVTGENRGYYDVAKVQLTYRYALLR